MTCRRWSEADSGHCNSFRDMGCQLILVSYSNGGFDFTHLLIKVQPIMKKDGLPDHNLEPQKMF